MLWIFIVAAIIISAVHILPAGGAIAARIGEEPLKKNAVSEPRLFWGWKENTLISKKSL